MFSLFAKGDLAAFQHAYATFSRELDALVASPLYPRCPEQPIPRMVCGLRASFQSRQHQLGDCGIVVVADSAGGLLAALLLESLHDQGRRPPEDLLLQSLLLDLNLIAVSVFENRDRDPLVKPDRLKWFCSPSGSLATRGRGGPSWCRGVTLPSWGFVRMFSVRMFSRAAARFASPPAMLPSVFY